VYPYSKNGTRASSTLDRNNIEKQDGSMKVASQQEDLQFLAQILQEQLRAEVPSGDLFQVKCAVKNDQLMVLAQHSAGIIANTETVFAVLEETLRSLPGREEQRVELFLRVVGQKLPYTKQSIILRTSATYEPFEAEEIEEPKEDIELENIRTPRFSNFLDRSIEEDSDSQSFSRVDEPSINSGDVGSFSSPLLNSSLPDDSNEDEPFDPMADAPDLSTYSSSKPIRKIKPILIGTALAVVTLLSGITYFLIRPCSISECKEIQTARQLQESLNHLKLNARSEQELPKLQQQLAQSSTSLKGVPFWSSYHQEAEKLVNNFSTESEKINQIVKAFEAGKLAIEKSRTPATSMQDLQARQQMWRQAIAPLETINSNSELYKIVLPKLLIYRSQLKVVKQQLLAEEKWIAKLAAAKAVAMEASKREATAKTLQELQRVQTTWQVAVNALAIIPPSSSVYKESQKLLGEYKPYLATARIHATKELLAAKTYNQAVTSANLAKRYEQQNQWQAAVTHWNQAVNSVKQVTDESMYHSQAQALVTPYSAALKQAQDKLQTISLMQRTRTDLNRTCYSTIRICDYKVEKQGITVQLTPEYQQILQTSVTNVSEQSTMDAATSNQSSPDTTTNTSEYLQKLQETLNIISDNVSLPLVIYDVQGNAIHVHNPGE
jgi:tetratricopeptide (TPR) repeat protein